MTFLDFFFLLHIYLLIRNFFVSIKISYRQLFREIMGGGQKKGQFSGKKSPQAERMTFFDFLFYCTSTHRDETFLFLPKIFITSTVQRNHAGQNSVATTTTINKQQQQTTTTKNKQQTTINDQRTTNNEQRTTNTTDDHNTLLILGLISYNSGWYLEKCNGQGFSSHSYIQRYKKV